MTGNTDIVTTTAQETAADLNVRLKSALREKLIILTPDENSFFIDPSKGLSLRLVEENGKFYIEEYYYRRNINDNQTLHRYVIPEQIYEDTVNLIQELNNNGTPDSEGYTMPPSLMDILEAFSDSQFVPNTSSEKNSLFDTRLFANFQNICSYTFEITDKKTLVLSNLNKESSWKKVTFSVQKDGIEITIQAKHGKNKRNLELSFFYNFEENEDVKKAANATIALTNPLLFSNMDFSSIDSGVIDRITEIGYRLISISNAEFDSITLEVQSAITLDNCTCKNSTFIIQEPCLITNSTLDGVTFSGAGSDLGVIRCEISNVTLESDFNSAIFAVTTKGETGLDALTKNPSFKTSLILVPQEIFNPSSVKEFELYDLTSKKLAKLAKEGVESKFQTDKNYPIRLNNILIDQKQTHTFGLGITLKDSNGRWINRYGGAKNFLDFLLSLEQLSDKKTEGKPHIISLNTDNPLLTQGNGTPYEISDRMFLISGDGSIAELVQEKYFFGFRKRDVLQPRTESELEQLLDTVCKENGFSPAYL